MVYDYDVVSSFVCIRPSSVFLVVFVLFCILFYPDSRCKIVCFFTFQVGHFSVIAFVVVGWGGARWVT